MSRITLLGASGFVGTRLIEQLGSGQCQNIDKCPSAKYPDITILGDIREGGIENLISKEAQTVVLLAAEHRDDVSPTSLYYDVNVEGTRNVLSVMDKLGIKKIIFTSSVAVYGLNKKNPDENHPADPFNHYGKSKWQAEEVLREWYNKDPQNRSLTIIRPTVIFGERNRGNVYNLLRQIASGRFFKIGSCENKKSMAYVGNVAAFIEHCIHNNVEGYHLYNYIDKPDLSMNKLVEVAGNSLGKRIPSVKIPYFVGMFGGGCFDVLAWLTRKKLSISSVRVKKFCATTQFDANKAHASGFKAPYSLSEGLDRTLKFEFVNKKTDDIVYVSE